MAGSEDVHGHFVHLREDVSLKAYVQVGVSLVNEQLEFVETQLVSRLELTVVVGSFLDSVVC